MDPASIERDLRTDRVGRNVLCFGEVASTNDTAFDAARQDAADGLVVTAESQSAGRGRQGRRWLARTGEALLASVVLVDQPRKLNQRAVTIAAGLAVAEGIAATTGLETELKWPNDVLIVGRKVSGVLVEVRSVLGRRIIVVGFGVNVVSSPAPADCELTPTSLAGELSPGAPPARETILRAILRRLDHWISIVTAGRLGELGQVWLGRCAMLHRRVRAEAPGGTYLGTLVDVAPLEGLVLACDDGRRVLLPAETTTLRPLEP